MTSEATSRRPVARRSGEVSTLRDAWWQFLRHRSPWTIAAVLAAAVVLRVALGDFSWRDAMAAAGLLAIYPFGEWATHVYLLHARPIRLRGRTVELPSTVAHRQHHVAPNRLDMVLLDRGEIVLLLGLAVPLVVWLGSLPVAAFAGDVPLGVLVSAVIAGHAAIFAYEWCHFLIHTAYRPRTRLYRSIWRSHRLHHFKNERYWHGVTSNLSDRILGTFPDQRSVPRSLTARTLGVDQG